MDAAEARGSPPSPSSVIFAPARSRGHSGRAGSQRARRRSRAAGRSTAGGRRGWPQAGAPAAQFRHAGHQPARCRGGAAHRGWRASALPPRCGRHTSPRRGRRADRTPRRNHAYEDDSKPPASRRRSFSSEGSAPARSRPAAVVGSSAIDHLGVVGQRHCRCRHAGACPRPTFRAGNHSPRAAAWGCGTASSSSMALRRPFSSAGDRAMDPRFASISWSPTR